MEREPRVTQEGSAPVEAYEPPAIAWEEPFDPVAASLCCNLGEPGCSPENACP